MSTRHALDRITANLEESMGVRGGGDARPVLAPVPAKRDAGRRPLRNVGRLAIDQVVPDPDQPRVEFSEDALERLALSIREKGQLSPIRVRWSDRLEKWLIVSGERRWRAVRRAGLPDIECYFHEAELTPSEILEQQLIENLLREDLRPVEEARAFSSLMGLNGWTGKEVADALRVHPSRVSRALALLRLPGPVQERVNAGEIPARAAYEISKLPDPAAQAALAERAVEQGLSHEDAARAVRQRRGRPKPPARTTRQAFAGPGAWKVVVTGPGKAGYPDIEQALLLALNEVRERIRTGRKPD
jgi:ParB family chromosome partitioning protein